MDGWHTRQLTTSNSVVTYRRAACERLSSWPLHGHGNGRAPVAAAACGRAGTPSDTTWSGPTQALAATTAATLVGIGLLSLGRKRRADAPHARRVLLRAAATSQDWLTQLRLTPSLERVLMAQSEGVANPCILVVSAKEGPAPVQGCVASYAASDDAVTVQDPAELRSMPANSLDFVVEAISEEMTVNGWPEAWQCRFYPLGGHEFSLARTFIINLASIAKVLRVGGKFIFRTKSQGQEDLLPFAFLRSPHLAWDLQVLPDDVDPTAAVVVCTLREGAHAVLAAQTPAVIAEQCLAEETRRRYFEVLRPHVFAARREATGSANPADTLSILDVGGGNGSLVSCFFDPEVLQGDGPARVTLMEENDALVQQARARLPVGDDASSLAQVVTHGVCPWPFEDDAFDVVILAFVLHHITPTVIAEAFSYDEWTVRFRHRDPLDAIGEMPQMQTHLPNWSDAEKADLVEWLTRNESVWPLAQHRSGTRLLQDVIGSVPPVQQEKLAGQLADHITEALYGAESNNANFVLQSCAAAMTPATIQWVLDFMVTASRTITVPTMHPACDEKGVRLLCRTLEHFTERQFPSVAVIYDWICQHAQELATHSFANYAVQHALEYGSDAHRQQIAQALLKGNVLSMAVTRPGSYVLQKVLKFAPPAECQALAHALGTLRPGGLVGPEDLKKDMFGSFLYKQMKDQGLIVKGPDRSGKLSQDHGGTRQGQSGKRRWQPVGASEASRGSAAAGSEWGCRRDPSARGKGQGGRSSRGRGKGDGHAGTAGKGSQWGHCSHSDGLRSHG
eukprot:TRINITY_DN25290_c0_g1_i1.p1 TRINITY_DN25290_c0_g1~~TRINITY_DN25290_c0_g1_i1.p1  ORF type:complete len:791 (+),score=127.69 TRINITY_DN25290_c0_g1_i1:94-2466(+)